MGATPIRVTQQPIDHDTQLRTYDTGDELLDLLLPTNQVNEAEGEFTGTDHQMGNSDEGYMEWGG